MNKRWKQVGKGGNSYPPEIKSEFDRARIRACYRLADRLRQKAKREERMRAGGAG